MLTIKARDIEQWAERHLEARSLLAILLRKLAHSTGEKLSHVDFPDYDNAERKGWDGEVEANAVTAGQLITQSRLSRNPQSTGTLTEDA